MSCLRRSCFAIQVSYSRKFPSYKERENPLLRTVETLLVSIVYAREFPLPLSEGNFRLYGTGHNSAAVFSIPRPHSRGISTGGKGTRGIRVCSFRALSTNLWISTWSSKVDSKSVKAVIDSLNSSASLTRTFALPLTNANAV